MHHRTKSKQNSPAVSEQPGSAKKRNIPVAKKPKSKSGSQGRAHSLRVKIDNEWSKIELSNLCDPQQAEQWEQRLNASDTVVDLSNLLRYSEREIHAVVEFVCSLGTIQVRVSETKTGDVFDAMLSLLVNDSDLTRYERAKTAALHAAVLLFPNALEAACNRIVSKLRDLKQKGLKVQDLIRDARQLQKAMQISIADAIPRSRAKDVLPDAPVDPEYWVPDGWHLSPNGLCRQPPDPKESKISAPILIVERGKNIQNATESVTLAWHRDGKWHETTADKKQIANARDIVDLADRGLPVTSNNARTLVQFLYDCESENAEAIDVTKYTNHMGWHKENNEISFVVGKRLINSKGATKNGGIRFCGADAGDEQLAHGFRKAGKLDGWIKAIQHIHNFPRALLGFYAGFVPPLLKILQTPNFIFDYAGKTTTGKSTVLRVIASIWGNPNEHDEAAAIATWNTTLTWRERAPSVCRDLPIVLDDTKSARFPTDISNTIYSIAQGRGRGRGTVRSLARSEAIRTVLFSSGEQPATSFTRDGGTRARVLSIWGSPFGETNTTLAEYVRNFNRLLLAHYGHAGPRFVEFLLDNKNQYKDWRRTFNESVRNYEEHADGDTIAARKTAHLAAIHLVSQLVHDALDLPWDWKDPVEPIWDELIESESENNVAFAALELVVNWAVSNTARFFHARRRGQEAPNSGWAGRWEHCGESSNEKNSSVPNCLAFMPHVINELLQDHGYEPESTIRTWKDFGWLQTDKDGNRNTKKTQIDGKSCRVVAIRGEALNEVFAQD